jgi:hypothetical protein
VLRGDFTDASMMREWERFVSLFMHDGTWRIPNVNIAPSLYRTAGRTAPDRWPTPFGIVAITSLL